MQYVYHLLTLLVWVGICAVLVYALERVLDAFDLRPAPSVKDETHVPPLPPAM